MTATTKNDREAEKLLRQNVVYFHRRKDPV